MDKMTHDNTAKRPKPAPSAFANAKTREELADAIQNRLANGRLKSTDLRAIDLICRLKAWDQPPTRHFVGERFSQAGVVYVVIAVDGTGQISEAKEILAPNAPNAVTPDAAPEFV
jgi:hypothetical protein